MRRRDFLRLPAALAAPRVRAEADYPQVRQGTQLVFPRDHGAHPGYRTEWWYATGWLGDARGFQVTFFRHRPGIAEENPSRFAATQLLFAHVAVSDPDQGRLLSEQRTARAGFGLAFAEEADTRVKIDDWLLDRRADGYHARVIAREFELQLTFVPTQAVLLQGIRGYSRKGPRAGQASFYYSWPQLRVQGSIDVRGKTTQVQGRAWLDHEWSSEALAPEAVGWDWAGINGEDGSALMAFRIRSRTGETYWAGGSFRSAEGRLMSLRPGEVAFQPLGEWRSPRTGTTYPLPVRLRAGTRELDLAPLMPDQEVDARTSTGNIYWEGAVSAKGYGRGYLELTGYGAPLKL